MCRISFTGFTQTLLFTAQGPRIITASEPFKVAWGEGPDARLHYFNGSDAVQRGARPRE